MRLLLQIAHYSTITTITRDGALADRYQRELVLLFVDIDNLQRINDSIGFHQGDTALAVTGAALRETFRGCDIVARWGGDEFVVLTSECPATKTEALVKRLTANLWVREVAAGLQYQLKVSVGCALCDPAERCGLGELVRRADENMKQQRVAQAVVA